MENKQLTIELFLRLIYAHSRSLSISLLATAMILNLAACGDGEPGIQTTGEPPVTTGSGNTDGVHPVVLPPAHPVALPAV